MTAQTNENTRQLPQGVILNRYEVAGTVLGSGSEGTLVRARDSTTGRSVAVKRVTADRFINGPVAADYFGNEVKSLHFLPPHPNVCGLLDYAEENDCITMVLELATTDLHAMLTEESHLPMATVKDFMRQVLSGLVHCHRHNVAHRDVKLENVLVFETNDDASTPGTTVRLCDFGLSVIVTDQNREVTGVCGSVPSVAPEVLTGRPYNPKGVDVCGAGILLYNMATSFSPWGTAQITDPLFECFQNSKEKFWAWTHHYSPQRLDSVFEELFNGMCNPDPLVRFTAEQALNHPFFL